MQTSAAYASALNLYPLPVTHYLQCDHTHLPTYRMAYHTWGNPSAKKLLICVHGLTRCGRDFAALASTLVTRSPDEYYVVAPDVVGRGDSDWLANSMFYDVKHYMFDMDLLWQKLSREREQNQQKPYELYWLGTSMGGLIGMGLASTFRVLGMLPTTLPIQKIIFNDVGPVLAVEALQRIAQYVGLNPSFDSFETAAQYIRKVSQSFGMLTDEQWHYLAAITVKHKGNEWLLHYDPKIADPFKLAYSGTTVEPTQTHLWPFFDTVNCPMMVVRGSNSDLLTPATLLEISQHKPQAVIREIANCGHAPALMAVEQIQLIQDFLQGE
jgi:pimeloyl-ACP methyl ester carboxylesterase